MSGIAGFIDPAGSAASTPGADRIRAMMAALAQGPGTTLAYHADPDSGLHLGVGRPVPAGAQGAAPPPLTSASGRFALAFHGRLLNGPALRRELESEGVRVGEATDLEVLAGAFAVWGPERAVARLRGMFAFALHDRESRALWLARDPMGVHSLYVARRGRALIFGTELRALLAHPLVEARGDPEAAWHYLRTLHVPAPLSMVAGVDKLLPGTLARFDLTPEGVGPRTDHRYWRLDEVAAGPIVARAPDEAVDELHAVLSEAVRLRQTADVPVGALLSGGIDSALVVALMAAQSDQPVRTFTVRFDDPRFDEGPAAAEIADRLGARHTAVQLPAARVRDLIPDLGAILNEPLANPAILPSLLVCEVARADVPVALSGDGGDELFGGYNRYVQAPRIIQRAAAIPTPLRTTLARALRAGVGSRAVEAVGRRLQGANFGEQSSFAARLTRAAGIVGAPDARTAYLEALAVGHPTPPLRGVRGPSPRHDTGVFDRHAGSLFARMALLDQHDYLPDDLLATAECASRRTGLETRAPLLDPHVVRWSWTVADDLKIRDGRTKWPLRRLLERYLPPEVMERPKMGFTVPIERWLRGELVEWMADRLAPAALARRGIYDVEAVGALRRRFDGGRGDLALPLWTLAVLEDWATRRGVTF